MLHHSQYVPSTFEERGTAVPFTTPLLAGARVRLDGRTRLELLVASLSGAQGVYVIPWPAVTEVMSLTLHDVVLHAEVLKEKALTPSEMRLVALRTAKTGLAGPEAAANATRVLSGEDEHAALINLLVVLAAVTELKAVHEPGALLKALSTEKGQVETRAAIVRAAKSIRIAPDEFDRRVAQFASMLGPVGIMGGLIPAPGRLRRIAEDLPRLGTSFKDWSRETGGDAGSCAAFCGEVVDYTSSIVTDVLAKLDVHAGGPGTAIARWEDSRGDIEKLATRLSWLLDGWEAIVSWWFRARETSRTAEYQALEGIFRVLPLVPKSEAPDTRVVIEADIIYKLSRRFVRSFEDWRTGAKDFELIRRLELSRSDAA